MLSIKIPYTCKSSQLQFVLQIRVPVWIHADIFKGPLGEAPAVDKNVFIKHVQRLFPQCTMSLGWTTGSHTDLSLFSYTWDMVLDMYHFVHEHEIQPPLVFTMRASFIHNSVPQMKWLTDNTRSSVLVYNFPEDRPLSEDLMYVCYRFAPHNSYFDIPDENMRDFVEEYRDRSSEKLNRLVMDRQTVIFKPQAWVKMGLHIEKHSILPSEEALILNTKTVYVLTKSKFKPSQHISLNGRVQFLNRKQREIVTGETGLNFYMRPTGYADFEYIVGIRCFIGADGFLTISGSNLKGVPDFRKTHRIVVGTSNCFRYKIVDTGQQIHMYVTVMHNCDTLESTVLSERWQAEFIVDLPRDIGLEEHPYILKLEDSNRQAVIDELSVKYDLPKQPNQPKH